MMTSETRTPKEIEREIETQRSALTSNLEDLQDKFSIDTLVRQIGDQFREHGSFDLGSGQGKPDTSGPYRHRSGLDDVWQSQQANFGQRLQSCRR